MNSKKDIHKRNKKYLKDYFNLTFQEYLNLMKKAGKPQKFGDKWSKDNPTSGRCGSVVNAFRLSGKTPKDYIACWQKSDDGGTHYYFINPQNNNVIDPTCYQMEYDYKYHNYSTNFLPQVGNNVKEIMKIFGLKINPNLYKIKIVNNTLIVKKNDK